MLLHANLGLVSASLFKDCGAEFGFWSLDWLIVPVWCCLFSSGSSMLLGVGSIWSVDGF